LADSSTSPEEIGELLGTGRSGITRGNVFDFGSESNDLLADANRRGLGRLSRRRGNRGQSIVFMCFFETGANCSCCVRPITVEQFGIKPSKIGEILLPSFAGVDDVCRTLHQRPQPNCLALCIGHSSQARFEPFAPDSSSRASSIAPANPM